jgi:predicted nucleotidyltransferase
VAIEAIQEFARRVRDAYGPRVRELTLFGSRARGEARDDSDADVLVVIDELTSAEGRHVAGLAGDILPEFDVLVSAFAISTEHAAHLRGRERLIAAEIARDGVPLGRRTTGGGT